MHAENSAKSGGIITQGVFLQPRWLQQIAYPPGDRMLKAYINYPNPHVTIHANAGCVAIHQQHKKDQHYKPFSRVKVDEHC